MGVGRVRLTRSQDGTTRRMQCIRNFYREETILSLIYLGTPVYLCLIVGFV